MADSLAEIYREGLIKYAETDSGGWGNDAYSGDYLAEYQGRNAGKDGISVPFE